MRRSDADVLAGRVILTVEGQRRRFPVLTRRQARESARVFVLTEQSDGTEMLVPVDLSRGVGS